MLIGNVGVIKNIGEEMGKEINNQNVILEKISDGVDKNSKQMKVTSNRFTLILENSSTWKLFVVIGIEIALLICIVLFV